MSNIFTRISTFLISLTAFAVLLFVGYNKFTNFSGLSIIGEKLYSIPPADKIETLPFLKVVVLADTHLNFSNAVRVLTKVSLASPDLIIHLGDHTDYGDMNSLRLARSYLESFSIPYIALPGDRDIAATQNTDNFSVVFKELFKNNEMIDFKGLKFFFFSNMYNFTPFDSDSYRLIMKNVAIADIIFSSQPLFVPDSSIFSSKFMGSSYLLKSDTGYNLDPSSTDSLTLYSTQSSNILSTILKREVPLLVISGDHHKSSFFTHPSSNVINFHIVGALAESIDSGALRLKQTALQSRRFSVISFFSDSVVKENFRYKIEEIEIND